MEGLMEKEGQVNTRFQERFFVLWPREECKLVARGFRVLYYFDSASATKAKGRVRIDQPDIEDLTKEREGQCVLKISPNSETSEQATEARGMTLESFLESRKQPSLDARPLTLRWLSSVQSDDFEQMEKWSAALGGRRADNHVELASDTEGASKAHADGVLAEVMTSAQQQRVNQFEAGVSDQEMQVGTRIRVEGHGIGVYERFEKNMFGSNSHFIRFGQSVLTLELPQLRWAVLDETEDGSELEREWAETKEPSALANDSAAASATASQLASEPEPEPQAGLEQAQQQQERQEQTSAEAESAGSQRLPPCGLCWKRKQNIGFTWPERFIALSQPVGKAHMGLYVFAKEGDDEPRGSSIEKLLDVEVTKGIESWSKLQGGDKFKLTLSADFLPEKSACFCFEEEGRRDEFFDACANLAAGRPWYLSAAQAAKAKAEEEERAKQKLEEEINRRVAAEAAEAIRVATEKAVEEERQRAAKEAQEKKIRQAQAAMARKEKEAAEKAAREEAEAAATVAAATQKVSSDAKPDALPVGTQVQVWSASSSQWCDGTVKEGTADGSSVVVTYRVGEKKKTKTISSSSQELKVLSADDAAAPNLGSSSSAAAMLSLEPPPVGVADRVSGEAPAPRQATKSSPKPQRAGGATPLEPEPQPASAASFDSTRSGAAAPVRKGPHKIGCGFRFILPEDEFVEDSRVSVCEDNMCDHAFVEKGGMISATKWRRHHCRSCGHVFCAKCSSERYRLIDPQSATGGTRKERVCDQCFATLSKGDEPTKFEK